MRTTLLHDRAVKLSKAEAHVYSDTVMCLGRIHEHLQSIHHWRGKIEWFVNTLEHRELNGIDGEPIEFEWHIFPGHTILELPHEIQRKMAENRIRPEEFKDRIIFVDEPRRRLDERRKHVFRILLKFRFTKTDLRRDMGHSSDQERKKMLLNAHPQAKRLVEPICRDDNDSSSRKWTSCLSRHKCVGPSKKRGNLSIHHNGDLSTAELLFRTIISVNQLRVHGAISDWCEELAQQISDHSFSSTKRPVANVNEQFDCRLSPELLSLLTNPRPINVPAQGNLLRSHSERFEKLPEDMQVIAAGETGGFRRKISSGPYFVTIHDLDDGFGGGARACRDDGYSIPEGWIRGHTKIGPVREVRVTNHLEQCGIETDPSRGLSSPEAMNKYVAELIGMISLSVDPF